MRIQLGIFLALFSLLFGCENSKEAKVLFSNVTGLKIKSPVYLDSLVIGQISDMKIRKDGNIIVTLKLNSEIDLPKSSKIQYQVDFLGNSYIEFISSSEFSEFDRPQEGNQVTFDSLTSKNLSQHEVDSILKNNPNGEIIDTVLKLMQSISSRKQNIDALNREGILLAD